MPRSDRDYDKEYAAQRSTEKKRKRHAARLRARRYLERTGRLRKGDSSKEVDHINHNAEDNSPSNLRVVSKKTNREKQPKRS